MKLFACFPIFACRGKIDSLDYSCQKLEVIPDIVFKHGKNLEDLNLGMNNIVELPLGLFKMHKLQRLILSNNRIGGIPSQIGDLKYLVELDISNNEICDISEDIEKCQNLVILDVSHNILPGSLPKTIVNLTNLTNLSLNDNSVTNLPNDIDKLINLKSLDARECELRDLPPAIVKLRNLQRLDLGDNALTRLPENIGELINLRELDLEKNSLQRLPDDLLKCINLESLVICNNNLIELPFDIGQLNKLIELNANENELSVIPSSIRLLTNLKILKLNENSIQEVPQSVGSLSSLRELYLYKNSIRTLPSSIGNLKNLEFLDVCENQLTSIPSTIGSTYNLGTLLLRGNLLREIPDEIGKLNNLKVLDLSENKLNYLPYTMIALKDTLKTIYLRPGRPIKVVSLKEGQLNKFNVKTLTCYDLPQKDLCDATKLPEIKSTIGGTRVNFVGDYSNDVSIEDKQNIGNFERYGTPHPKHFAPKNQQKMIQAKRNSQDLTSILAPTAEPEDTEPIQMRPLRSVLKRRPQSTSSLKDETKSCIIRKYDNSFGFKLCGGIDSIQPYKEADFGFFVSEVTEGGPANQAGVIEGDKILAVNGQPVSGLTHGQCTSLIQDGDLVELRLEPEIPESSDPIKPPENTIELKTIPTNSKIEEPKSIAPVTKIENNSMMSTDIISVTFKCDINGNPGFTITGGLNMPICINDIIPNGPAAKTKMLKHGDRLVSINGKNVKHFNVDDVSKMLKANSNDLDLYLIVERINFKSTSDLTKALLTPSRSMPSLFCPELLEETTTNQSSAFVAFSRTQHSFTYGHKRKPSAEFKMIPQGTKINNNNNSNNNNNNNTSFLIELSKEPSSGFSNKRSRSIGNLALSTSTFDSNNSTNNVESYPSTSNELSEIKNSLIEEKTYDDKPSQLKQPTMISLKKEIVSSPSPLPNDSSTPIPPEKLIETRIPKPTKIPPPVAPKPKLNLTTNNVSKNIQEKLPEKLDFSSKRQMFEITSAKNNSKMNTNIPPPKKPLLSSNDIQRLKEDETIRTTKNIQSPEEESGYIPSPSEGGYEQLLNNIVTPTMPQVIRTKKAEMRAQSALASTSSSSIRPDSSASGRISVLDETEIEKQRRWRTERKRSLDDVQKDADEIITQFSQISQISNMSAEPIPTN